MNIKLKNNSLFVFILIVAFVTSTFLTYVYTDFKYNMSIGVGYAYTAKSIALSHNFDVDEYWQNAGVDVIDYNDDKLVAYPPLNSVIMSVPYWGLQITYHFYNIFIGHLNGDTSLIFESLAMRLPSIIFFLLIGTELYALLKKYGITKNKRALVLISFFWGTIFLNYSVSFFNHIQSAFFILSAYYLLDKSASKKNYLLAGCLTGLAFLTEYPTVFFSVAVFASTMYLYFQKKLSLKDALIRLTLFAIPVAASIVILGLFNWYTLGTFFKVSEQILYEQKSLLGTQQTFSQNPLYGIWGLYFSPLKGLFLISPFLIYSFFGFSKFYKINKFSATLGLSYILLVSVLYSFWPDCFGATVFGPRYLITVIPFLIFYSAHAITSQRLAVLYLILFLYAFYICLMNLLDGLPSGSWFGMYNCNSLQYASLFKADNYFIKMINGKNTYAPALLRKL